MSTAPVRRAARHIESLVSPFRRRHSIPADEALARLRSVEVAAQVAQAELVDAMRDASWSWSQIGAALGVSKQAAQQRYSQKPQRQQDPHQLTLTD